MLWDFSEIITALDEHPQNLQHARTFARIPDDGGPHPDQGDAFSKDLDGLFRILRQFKNIRHEARIRIQNGGLPGYLEDDTIRTYQDLCDWQCSFFPGSPQFIASHIYRSCIAVYFQRSIRPSTPHPNIKRAVDQGLWHIRHLAWSTAEISIEPILLTPLLLLGCAAFEAEQRAVIADAFRRLLLWADLDKIRAAQVIVQHTWALMDRGSEAESWDWETLIDQQYRRLHHDQEM
jgi:hypothetical protein